MLTIKCGGCKSKIFKYQKIGKGKVLRCYKKRIKRVYQGKVHSNKLICGSCNNVIGNLEERLIQMNQDSFTYSGKKD
ncbi:hypothetical protein [Natranaerobius trueperi]|uniref:Uncharacterized protein n=1 Tax=Natranaerobius trueperi TaxID=759412 RepID=A0A226BXM9_9FIRM|nr:hypothetical protein [Natranaerobius trueperi]OWZ83532.1 hypothetical protein CDO51_07965 [Natranaerobius trueperi]